MYIIIFLCLLTKCFCVTVEIVAVSSKSFESFEVTSPVITSNVVASPNVVQVNISPHPASIIDVIANFINLTSLVVENPQENFPKIENLSSLITSIKCGTCWKISNTTFTTSKLPSIVISGNNVTTIEDKSFGRELERLSIQNNHLSKFSSKWFDAPENLKILDLSHNLLTCPPQFQSLEFIDLSFNRIQEVTKTSFFPSLKTILLNNNQINYIEQKSFATHLMALDLSRNILTTVQNIFENCSNLELLDLQHNEIEDFPLLSTCGNLKILNFGHNRLKLLKNGSLPSGINAIYLHNNRITFIDNNFFGSTVQLIDLRSNLLEYATGVFLNATSLRELHFDANQLKKVPDLYSPELKTLSLSGNFLANVSKGDLKGIEAEFVDLARNSILWVEPNTFGGSVKILNITDNYLEKVDFLEEAKNLEELNLGLNSIKECPIFKNQKKLKSVVFSTNSIEVLRREMFQDVPLEYLEIDLNNISWVEKGSFGAEMRYLSLKYNQLTSSDFLDQAWNLEQLYLTGNKLETLSNLNHLKKLTYLDVHSSSLAHLDKNMFSQAPIETLVLFNNHIKTIEEGTFGGNVQNIYLSLNCITNTRNVFANLTNLTHLDLNYNALTEFPITNSSKLNSLFVKANRMTKLDRKNYAQIVEMSDNEITEMSDNVFGEELKELLLVFNKIEKILFGNVSNLEVLNIYGNMLNEIPDLEKATKLRHFFAYGNKIVDIPARKFAANPIDTIKLDENQISRIGEGAFGYVLKILSLRDNKLTNVNSSWFLNATALENLDLSHNLITHLQRDLFKDFSNLTTINLERNRITRIEPGVFGFQNFFSELLLDFNDIYEINSSVFSADSITFHLFNIIGNKLTFLSPTLLKKIKPNAFFIHGNPWQCACLDNIIKWWKPRNIDDIWIQRTVDETICIETTAKNYCFTHIDYKLVEVYESVENKRKDYYLCFTYPSTFIQANVNGSSELYVGGFWKFERSEFRC